MLSQLNEFADVFNLKENLETWKKTFNLELSFVMKPSKAEAWNYDSAKRVAFVVYE